MHSYLEAPGSANFPVDSTLLSSAGAEPRLAVGGIPLSDLAAEWSTPLYVLSGTQLATSASMWIDCAARVRPGTSVHFASKSLPVIAVLQALRTLGLCVEVSTAGEMHAALAAGFNGPEILVHGNAKSLAELAQGYDVGARFFVVDNLDDITRLAAIARPDRPARVVVRVVPEVAPATHPGMATAHRGQKFGIELDQLDEVVAQVRAATNLEFLGYHAHVGSQITRLEPFLEAVDRLVQLAPPRVLDIGGGLGVDYLAQAEVPTIAQFCDAVLGELNRLVDSDCEVVLEPGRSVSARAVVTVYRVETVKHGRDTTFVALDGGTSDNLEVVMGFHDQDAVVVDRDGPLQRCEVVGKHCDSGDVLVRGVDLAPARPGDLVALPATGAYSHAMASNYNAVPRPAMVWVEGGSAHLVVRRETIADVFARDIPLSD